MPVSRSPVITLTTDFGTADPYVGVMKGVILAINPSASIVDISHHIQPQSISEGAFIIGTSHRFFPKGTIHVVVVDPGVGTARKALLLVTPSASFLAPDNGVLSYVVREGLPTAPRVLDDDQVDLPLGYDAYELANPELWRHPVSATFHGRDIFAPVAAHLSLGLPFQSVGARLSRITWLPQRHPTWDGGALQGQVIHVDRFGNLITDIREGLLDGAADVSIEVKGRRIRGLSGSYGEGESLLAIVGSHGSLEVSVKNGSAARVLGARVGDAVRVVTAPPSASG